MGFQKIIVCESIVSKRLVKDFMLSKSLKPNTIEILRDRPNTSPACNACGKTGSLAHAFFECEEAYKIWKEINPKLSEILEGKNIQH